MRLSSELIEDYENGVLIVNLCQKYGVTYFVVRNELKKLGLIEEKSWGGKRANCGRKRIEGGS